MQITELLTPAYDAAWLPWAVQYFFLIGVATGAALLTAACAYGQEGSRARRLLPTAVLVLAMSAISAPVALLADLHQPARFWHFYAHFTPWSWMSIGSVLLPLFFALSVLMAALWWLGQQRWMRLLAPVLALSALSIVVYTGAEIMVIRARPLWNTLWVPVNLALTGWLATVGWAFVLYRFLPARLQPDAPALQGLRKLGLWLALALVAVGGLWAITGLMGGNASFEAALRLVQQFPVWRMTMVGSALLGTLVLVALLRGRTRMQAWGFSLVLGVALAAAAWAFRWALFMGVQGVPKFGAGLYLYHMPLGSDGLMGIVAVFGLCIAVVAAFVVAQEWFPARDPQMTA